MTLRNRNPLSLLPLDTLNEVHGVAYIILKQPEKGLAFVFAKLQDELPQHLCPV